MPTGPVTHKKAWIEMIHRYLATGVGVLILVMAVTSWLERARLALSPWWATATLVWVCVQGAFGALTVTMKLYPAIVTAHLLGGLLLLVLLTAQHQVYRARPLALRPGLRWMQMNSRMDRPTRRLRERTMLLVLGLPSRPSRIMNTRALARLARMSTKATTMKIFMHGIMRRAAGHG